MSDSLWPHGLYSPMNSPGQDTRVGRPSLLWGIFPTQGLNPGLLHCRWILYQLSHKGSQRTLEWVACPFSSRSSQPRSRTRFSGITGRYFTNWAIREVLKVERKNSKNESSWNYSSRERNVKQWLSHYRGRLEWRQKYSDLGRSSLRKESERKPEMLMCFGTKGSNGSHWPVYCGEARGSRQLQNVRTSWLREQEENKNGHKEKENNFWSNRTNGAIELRISAIDTHLEWDSVQSWLKA